MAVVRAMCSQVSAKYIDNTLRIWASIGVCDVGQRVDTCNTYLC